MKKGLLLTSMVSILGFAAGCGTELAPVNPLLSAAPPPCASTTAVYRVNVGDSAYTDSCNNLWAADQAYDGTWGYTGGNVGGPGAGTAIANTEDDGLFAFERYASPFDYKFTLPNGSYTVRLGFSEGWHTAAGGRVMSVSIEGAAVITNMDIFVDAGGGKTAHILSFPVTVADGELNIDFSATVDFALVNFIEIK